MAESFRINTEICIRADRPNNQTNLLANNSLKGRALQPASILTLILKHNLRPHHKLQKPEPLLVQPNPARRGFLAHGHDKNLLLQNQRSRQPHLNRRLQPATNEYVLLLAVRTASFGELCGAEGAPDHCQDCFRGKDLSYI
jgi:hypothetical protein